ncbi:hypothetical protein JYU34_018324 [Plutella xylostella]|uniref:Uncharacterized protein n=1 Tax=Plutella xylostella TaxID=51655 RepID=A0ABQ7Q0I2_PLUXY|nr:hypothetical protein JYU34_018324 [Plutella xylostella]
MSAPLPSREQWRPIGLSLSLASTRSSAQRKLAVLTSADRKEGTQKGRTSAFPFFRTWLRDSDRKEGTPTKANPRFPESPRRSPSQGADFAREVASATPDTRLAQQRRPSLLPRRPSPPP